MKITGGELSQKEITAYREYVKQNSHGRELIGIHIVERVCGLGNAAYPV